MSNTRMEFGKECELSIDEAIKVLTVIAGTYSTQQVQDAITTAILCMRKVRDQKI